jgi:DNA gyrase subunit A
MRYTEARLHKLALELISDIEKDTVDFNDNFDGTLTEPTVLPSALPNLLVNGATGIAVGMATSIPPHNLNEVVDALLLMLNKWTELDDLTVDDLMKYVQGPDFPTGGIILKSSDEDEGLAAAYGSGRGKVIVQAKVHVEEMERGRSRLIVTELPYQTNKSSLIERIAELARDGKLEGLADLRDESDRQGMRIVIELAKTADPNALIASLFKLTPMQSTFGINLLALVNNEPRTLTLKQSLHVFLDHRLEVVKRRSQFDLARAKERAHILEGLLIALKFLDEVIRIIRNSHQTEEARSRLMKRFKLTRIQTDAILEMPLRKIAKLEQKKIDDEYKEKKALIKSLEELLASPKKMRDVIAVELKELKGKYGDKRRTQIMDAGKRTTTSDSFQASDLIPDETTWVTMTQSGLLARAPKPPKLSKDDAPLAIVEANTKDLIYIVTQKGRSAAISTYSIPETEDAANGTPFSSLSPLDAAARVVTIVAIPHQARAATQSDQGDDAKTASPCLVIATALGMIKKIAASDLPAPSSKVGEVMKVNEDDRIIGAKMASGHDDVLLITAMGQSIRFKEDEVRAMGTGAAGVQAIKLANVGDGVVGLNIVGAHGGAPETLIITDNGMGKRVPVKEFPTQGRYGIGTTAMDLTGKAKIVSAIVGEASDKLIVITNKGARAMKFDDAPKRKRAMRGASIIELKNDDAVRMLVPFLNRLHVEEPKEKRSEVRSKKSEAGKQLQLDVKVPAKKDVKGKAKKLKR